MKIRAEFLFEDQGEFITFFQNWFEKQPADSLISEPEEITESVSEIIPETNISVTVCQNPDCGSEFETGMSGFKKYCSTKCYMHVYWSKRTKDKDGKTIFKEKVSEDHVKQLLKKCKETGIPPIKEPELNNRTL
jgi:hypothetical protein